MLEYCEMSGCQVSLCEQEHEEEGVGCACTSAHSGEKSLRYDKRGGEMRSCELGVACLETASSHARVILCDKHFVGGAGEPAERAT